MKTIAVVPARLESSRLSQKLLLNQTGRPLIIHTIESAQSSFQTVVATDSQEIYDAVRQHIDIQVIMTGACRSGTERTRRAMHFLDQFGLFPTYDVVINWQADEPEINSKHVVAALQEFDKNREIDIITLATPIKPADIISPDVVKVVVDHQQMAMYFSRSPIPYGDSPKIALKHIGVYGFRHHILSSLGTLDDTAYPTEKLEQLQWLESGLNIKVYIIPEANNGINTLEDYEAFVQRNALQI